jgi:hypothetical protein
LPLLSDDQRERWTPRMLAIAALLMAWSTAASLKDRFAQARAALTLMYRSRRQPGRSPEGFFKALDKDGSRLLASLAQVWRKLVQSAAGARWKVDGWLIFGVDGSKFDCPRTRANEQGFGISGKGNSGPQQLVTCLFHLASGILWGWARDGVQGRGEPTQLRESLLGLLPPGALLVADAGYTGYDLLRAICDSGGHFLIRVGSNLTLIKQLGYVKRENKQTVYLWPLDKQACSRDALLQGPRRVRGPLVLRLIELHDAKGRPVCLLTNVLSRQALSDPLARKIYRLRWGIELMWRGLKQTMGRHTMLGKTPRRAGAELDWALAGLWMMQLLTASRLSARGGKPQEQSPAQALRVIRAGLDGRKRRGKNLLEQLGRATKDTYRRHGSKQARCRRQKRPQRPPGPPEARMATTLEKQLAQRILATPPPDKIAA